MLLVFPGRKGSAGAGLVAEHWSHGAATHSLFSQTLCHRPNSLPVLTRQRTRPSSPCACACFKEVRSVECETGCETGGNV